MNEWKSRQHSNVGALRSLAAARWRLLDHHATSHHMVSSQCWLSGYVSQQLWVNQVSSYYRQTDSEIEYLNVWHWERDQNCSWRRFRDCMIGSHSSPSRESVPALPATWCYATSMNTRIFNRVSLDLLWPVEMAWIFEWTLLCRGRIHRLTLDLWTESSKRATVKWTSHTFNWVIARYKYPRLGVLSEFNHRSNHIRVVIILTSLNQIPKRTVWVIYSFEWIFILTETTGKTFWTVQATQPPNVYILSKWVVVQPTGDRYQSIFDRIFATFSICSILFEHPLQLIKWNAQICPPRRRTQRIQHPFKMEARKILSLKREQIFGDFLFWKENVNRCNCSSAEIISERQICQCCFESDGWAAAAVTGKYGSHEGTTCRPMTAMPLNGILSGLTWNPHWN